MSLFLRPGWVTALVLIIIIAAGCKAPRVSGAAGATDTPRGEGGVFTPPGGGALPPPVGVVLPPPGDAANPSQPCAEEAHEAEVVPLDLMMVVDASASMNEFAGTETKWRLAQTALSAFVRDPYFCAGPDGLAPDVGSLFCEPRNPTGSPRPGYPGCPVGTTCVPIGNCAGSGARCANIGQACPMGGGMCLAEKACWEAFPRPECEIARYEKPTVPIDPLPMSEMALTTTLRAWSPIAGTPMGPALRGVLAYLRARLAASPGRKAALVLVGDGLPDGCFRVDQGEPGMNDIPSIAAILGEAFTANPSIPTYVIGVFAPDLVAMSGAQMNRLAVAGGTDRAYVLNATSDLTQRLQEALNQIRGAASLACEFTIPPPTTGAIDFNKVNVRYTGPAGPENIPYVERADRCDPMGGGWYYDVEPARGRPQRIQVCEATCRRFKTDENAKVDLLFGCATRVIL